jgi:hypothetical protein
MAMKGHAGDEDAHRLANEAIDEMMREQVSK